MASKPAFFQTPTQFIPLTPSEQRLAWIERLKRPLTDDESAELQRCLHNVYCLDRKRG